MNVPEDESFGGSNLLQLSSTTFTLLYLFDCRNPLKGTAEVRPLLLEQSMHAQKPELQERLLKLKEIEQVTEATVSEIHRR